MQKRRDETSAFFETQQYARKRPPKCQMCLKNDPHLSNLCIKVLLPAVGRTCFFDLFKIRLFCNVWGPSGIIFGPFGGQTCFCLRWQGLVLFTLAVAAVRLTFGTFRGRFWTILGSKVAKYVTKQVIFEQVEILDETSVF